MNQEEFFNKNLIRELVYFIITVILISFIIGIIAMILYFIELPGTDYLVEYQVSEQMHVIKTNNVNVLTTGFVITSIIWIIRIVRSKSART